MYFILAAKAQACSFQGVLQNEPLCMEKSCYTFVNCYPPIFAHVSIPQHVCYLLQSRLDTSEPLEIELDMDAVSITHRLIYGDSL